MNVCLCPYLTDGTGTCDHNTKTRVVRRTLPAITRGRSITQICLLILICVVHVAFRVKIWQHTHVHMPIFMDHTLQGQMAYTTKQGPSIQNYSEFATLFNSLSWQIVCSVHRTITAQCSQKGLFMLKINQRYSTIRCHPNITNVLTPSPGHFVFEFLRLPQTGKNFTFLVLSTFDIKKKAYSTSDIDNIQLSRWMKSITLIRMEKELYKKRQQKLQFTGLLIVGE